MKPYAIVNQSRVSKRHSVSELTHEWAKGANNGNAGVDGSQDVWTILLGKDLWQGSPGQGVESDANTDKDTATDHCIDFVCRCLDNAANTREHAADQEEPSSTEDIAKGSRLSARVSA